MFYEFSGNFMQNRKKKSTPFASYLYLKLKGNGKTSIKEYCLSTLWHYQYLRLFLLKCDVPSEADGERRYFSNASDSISYHLRGTKHSNYAP